MPTPEDAICHALRDVIKTVNAVATVTYTNSGHTSMSVARMRPTAPILSITPNVNTARRLALVWGIHSTIGKDVGSVDEMVAAAVAAAVREGFAKAGERVTVSAGLPFGESGTTNLLHIATVK
jgi:pyruvate kinase